MFTLHTNLQTYFSLITQISTFMNNKQSVWNLYNESKRLSTQAKNKQPGNDVALFSRMFVFPDRQKKETFTRKRDRNQEFLLKSYNLHTNVFFRWTLHGFAFIWGFLFRVGIIYTKTDAMFADTKLNIYNNFRLLRPTQWFWIKWSFLVTHFV